MRNAFAVLAGSLAICLAASLPGAPAPAAKRPAWHAVEADGLALEIRAEQADVGTGDPHAIEPTHEHDVHLRLRNLTKEAREVRLRTKSGTLDHETGLCFVVRFPKGEVIEWTDGRYRVKYDKDVRLLRLASEGQARSVVNLQHPRQENFTNLYTKHDGRYCVSAVVGWLGLQSNLVRYNGCPEPPANYRPLDHTEFLPEKWSKVDFDTKKDPKQMSPEDLRDWFIFKAAQIHWMRELNKKK